MSTTALHWLMPDALLRVYSAAATLLAAVRDERFAERPAPPSTAVDFHVSALAQAGFTEVGTVWQLLDDYVVLGVK
ncbi:hypothetical protein A5784_01470 [Mycobacterium sp. 852013-50091_SCH5140682]|uniref:hypothetical protein n=1 Tax=Mycobacterium sp. 852013-50091_SCH5140682 TaxID=1834109 RepID=UPI0007EA6BE1|nr:hypothetical protein [Mycobacterium sp. 852013-50091_SCH5140682]OBC04211.1 hypothetical protein A5784_01470 [Mycobacterium sp. 852013-50091_SCH5140682]